MALSEKTVKTYSQILSSELMTAMGCTEPISIAFCASYARKLLGKEPERCVVHCSGNIIKNVKSVVVPQTGGLKGIEAAVAAGIAAAAPELQLEVLTALTDDRRKELTQLLDSGIIDVRPLDSGHALHIIVELFAQDDSVSVEVADAHTNIGRVVKNGSVLHENALEVQSSSEIDYSLLTVEGIVEYAGSVDLGDVREVLERQISYNCAISREGLEHVYGAGIGPTLMENAGNSLREQCKAAAAAGSDARMNGCSLPVVINSGSGNQGITVSLPVIVWAKNLGCTHEELLRALCVSNLIAVRQKLKIGKLSAFCGATSAAVGAICGIAYLDRADASVISQTIINALATIGGMVCDGAKSSCAGKIAAAIDCAFTAYEGAKKCRGYLNGEGLVKVGVEETIDSVGRMAARGMHGTDLEILDIMLDR